MERDGGAAAKSLVFSLAVAQTPIQEFGLNGAWEVGKEGGREGGREGERGTLILCAEARLQWQKWINYE